LFFLWPTQLNFSFFSRLNNTFPWFKDLYPKPFSWHMAIKKKPFHLNQELLDIYHTCLLYNTSPFMINLAHLRNNKIKNNHIATSSCLPSLQEDTVGLHLCCYSILSAEAKKYWKFSSSNQLRGKHLKEHLECFLFLFMVLLSQCITFTNTWTV